MFDLTPGDLTGPVLDCCAGGSGFTAATPGALAVDPAYALGFDEMARQVRASLPGSDAIVEQHRDRFEWDWFGNPEKRLALRTAAADAFLTDLREHPGRYVAGALPNLPLASGSVDLVLCSHLLFTWSDQLDEHWHRRALAELVRVARREVRIFPLVVQGTGEPVEFLDRLRAELPPSEVREVPYCFQRGARQMLVITPC
jgi:hypothetical protein